MLLYQWAKLSPHVELIGIIKKPLLLHLVGCLYYCINGRNYRPKHVELIGIINKSLLLHLVGCLCYCINGRNYRRNMLN